jgi:glycine/D-amino acid oxidase-like deaminating enzyme
MRAAAGQGGYGIQMAPALAQLVAAQVSGHQPPAQLAAAGVDAAALSPARLRQSSRQIRENAPREPIKEVDVRR